MRKSILAILSLSLSLAALSTRAADKASLEAHSLSYYNAGKSVVEMALTKKINPAEVEKKVEIMLADAVWAANEYAKAYPAGAKLLKLVADNVESMKKLSFKELEHEWHDLHYFEKAGKDIGLDLSAEENEHFTDPIHSIVHPLLVLKAAQSYATSQDAENLKSIKEEMEEGLEQMEKQKNVLLKK